MKAARTVLLALALLVALPASADDGLPRYDQALIGPLKVGVEISAPGERKWERNGPMIRMALQNTGAKPVTLRFPQAKELSPLVTIWERLERLKEVSPPLRGYPPHHPIHGERRYAKLQSGESEIFFVDPLEYLLPGYAPKADETYEIAIKPVFDFAFEDQSPAEQYANSNLIFGSREWIFMGFKSVRLAK